MAKGSNQKLKMLYLAKIFAEQTDEEHALTMQEIIARLNGFDVSANRKTLYLDFEELRRFGLDLISEQRGHNTYYYLGARDFELPELKLLVDSVQSSKFITHKKTMALIKKIESLASAYEAQLLSRQVYVKNRIKTMNESIYYNVDEIHTGIAQNKKIRFRYFDYTVSKERHFRRDNGFYVVSPFALTWDDENYYMVAFDSETGIIKHFRVDKMIDIEAIDEPRDGKDAYDALDMAVYARKVFGMFSGEEQRVRMRFDNQLVGAILDRLGRDVMLIPDGDSHFTVTADVVVSPQFFAWVCGFRSLAQIIGPEDVVQKMREHVADVMAMYN